MSDHIGVDLNRNTSSGFGTGSSSAPCGETYRGPEANSEVETKALQQLWRNLYRDRRGPAVGDAAPTDTTGVVLSMHSYSNLVMFPWGKDSRTRTGNDAPLRAMAKELAGIAGGWGYGQPGEVLYNAGGTTDDWVYDDLGVASFIWEVGAANGSCGGFMPPYSCQNQTHWPTVKPMLMYAAKKAANPYGGAGTPTGPAVTSPGDQTTVRDAVQLTVKASGGSTPYSWSATGLPAGLSLASDTGVISGKPTTAGTAKVAVTVKDANGKTGSTSFNWTVTDKSAATVTVTNPGNQWGFTGFAMNLQIKASSSDGAALTFSGTGLPPGVTISTSGLISGAPTARGTYSVTVTAKTAGGSSGSATFSIQVY